MFATALFPCGRSRSVFCSLTYLQAGCAVQKNLLPSTLTLTLTTLPLSLHIATSTTPSLRHSTSTTRVLQSTYSPSAMANLLQHPNPTIMSAPPQYRTSLLALITPNVASLTTQPPVPSASSLRARRRTLLGIQLPVTQQGNTLADLYNAAGTVLTIRGPADVRLSCRLSRSCLTTLIHH